MFFWIICGGFQHPRLANGKCWHEPTNIPELLKTVAPRIDLVLLQLSTSPQSLQAALHGELAINPCGLSITLEAQ